MLYFIDLFCGAGGVTEGVHNAKDSAENSVAKVVYCVNHDEVAIESHRANHPDCLHAVEDIRTFNVRKIVKVVEKIKQDDDTAIIVLWASLDCTQHSRAKGNLPKKADSRTLAWDLYPYIDQINPDYIFIENVREFMKWGPLNDENFVIKSQQGLYFEDWLFSIKQRNYQCEYQMLNAADFGAYQSRDRLFIIFAKPNLPIAFPKPTHSKKNKRLSSWKPVREVLSLENEGITIFNRKKPLSDRTILRILSGIKKHSIYQEKSFVNNYYTKVNNDSSSSIESPSPTITTIPHQALVTAKPLNHFFVLKYLGNNVNSGVNNGISIDNPCVTITTQNRLALVKSEYLLRWNSSERNLLSVDTPSPTILTKDTLSKIRVEYFIINPQWGTQSQQIEKPCFTIIARTDKAPPYLVSLESGQFALMVEPQDSEAVIELKKEMASKGIVDIKMRMFLVDELKRIQGFRDDYILMGSKEKQKKHIGNAVHTLVSQKITESLSLSLTQMSEPGLFSNQSSGYQTLIEW